MRTQVSGRCLRKTNEGGRDLHQRGMISRGRVEDQWGWERKCCASVARQWLAYNSYITATSATSFSSSFQLSIGYKTNRYTLYIPIVFASKIISPRHELTQRIWVRAHMSDLCHSLLLPLVVGQEMKKIIDDLGFPKVQHQSQHRLQLTSLKLVPLRRQPRLSGCDVFG